MRESAHCGPLRDRLLAVGLSPITTEELLDLAATAREAKALHRLVDILQASAGLGLLPQFARRRMSPERVQSMLRAAGHIEGKTLHPAAIDHIREALITPARRATPSPYLQRRNSDHV